MKTDERTPMPSQDDRWGEETAGLLRETAEQAIDFLRSLPERPVRPAATLAQLRAAFDGPLPTHGLPPTDVLRLLAQAAEPGVMGTAGPRFFGFVIGGTLPAALAADWLTSTWDQNAHHYPASPASSVAEEVAAQWLLDLFDLPRESGVGFTTGCEMAHFVALAAARRHVLLRHGWDVEERGLQGAPPIRVLVGDEVHVTIPIALQMLGLGSAAMERVAVDDHGRMRPDALREALSTGERTAAVIVCAQAGNINTGACDPLDEIADVVRGHEGAWLHVDGAFGLWARTAPHRRHLVKGMERADSWASDSHKWLNVPYDSGFVIVRDRELQLATMRLTAAYVLPSSGDERDPSYWVPEFSRRARGFAVYAALLSLGRSGVADLVERCASLAAKMAERLAAEPGVEVLNDVVLNQVLVRFGKDDDVTRDVIARVQADGTAWLGGSVWRGRGVMRISVSNWSTTEADADMTVEAILRCYREAAART